MNNNTKSPLSAILYIIGGILIITGIIIAVRVNLAANERESLKDKYIETQGVVDSVDTSYGRGKRHEKIVIAHYEVDGKVYDNVRINDYPAGVKKGDTVPIYYDPDNPKVIILEPGRGNILGANVISLVIAAIGFAAIVYGGKYSKSKSEINYESRFVPYESYTGETTERAGTLFDHEVDPKDLYLDDEQPKKQFGRRKHF